MVPYESNGTWYANIIQYESTDQCLIGHVTLSNNRAVGSALIGFYVTNRVLDNDQYTVAVTP